MNFESNLKDHNGQNGSSRQAAEQLKLNRRLACTGSLGNLKRNSPVDLGEGRPGAKVISPKWQQYLTEKEFRKNISYNN